MKRTCLLIRKKEKNLRACLNIKYERTTQNTPHALAKRTKLQLQKSYSRHFENNSKYVVKNE